tara:strand:- start:1132 stop:1845 length:714 start_codon:yes stop_codon:yes gene_type:complete
MKAVYTIIKWLVLISSLSVILSFTNSNRKNQIAYLNNIEIDYKKFIDNKNILKYLTENYASFDSTLISDIDFVAIEKALNEHPYIKKAEIYTDQTGKVNLSLKNRIPFVRIINNSDDFYLDSKMTMFPINDNYTENVLIITGEFILTNSKAKKLITLINNNEFWRSQITQIHFIAEDDVILITRVGDQLIEFGDLNNQEDKLNNLNIFYKKVMPVQGWQKYSKVSLKFSNQIVCTKK